MSPNEHELVAELKIDVLQIVLQIGSAIFTPNSDSRASPSGTKSRPHVTSSQPPVTSPSHCPHSAVGSD